MIRSIPLNKLQHSAFNVRHATDQHADDQLKSDIAAHGLLQNLVVTAMKKPRGHFAVEAGGRRLAALRRLGDDGTIAADMAVPCLILDGDAGAAQEASLAENFQQLRMNPADECQAFQSLVAQGLDSDDIARRFGLTRRFVDGRLRLADLAPVVLEALGANAISLDVAKAFAATSDRDRQAHVYAQMCAGYGSCHPDSIRRMMTQATLRGSDRRARFVGEASYLAAGGRIERDLFADDETARWLDIDLVERLAADRLGELAEAQRRDLGIAFVVPTLDGWIGYRHTEALTAVSLGTPPLTDEEVGRVEALEEQLGGVIDALDTEEMSDEARAQGEARIRQLQDEIDAIEDRMPVLPDELRDRLGTFLLLDELGRPRLHRTFYLDPADDDHGDNGGIGNEATARDAPVDRDAYGIAGEPTVKVAGLSQRHADELAMQRREILALHIARDPATATSLAIFLMADRAGGYRGERSGSTIAASRPNDPVLASQMPDTAACAARQEIAEALDRSWAELDSVAERFMAFRALAPERQSAWLGHLVADSLEASLNEAGQRGCGLHDQLGELLGIDPATWWRPTGANYFDRVPKGVSLAALSEVGGAELAGRYAKVKKTELAEACERLFAGESIVEAEVKQAALVWVPAVMRFMPPPWIAAPVAEADPDDASSGQTGIDLAPAAADGSMIADGPPSAEQPGVPAPDGEASAPVGDLDSADDEAEPLDQAA